MIQKKHLSSDEGSSDDDEQVTELLDKKELVKLKQDKNARTSVSAEVYGKFNVKGNFKPKKVAKNADAQARIKTRLSQAFMFSSLEDGDQQIVVDAMEEKKFNAGTAVITQGEDGDVLYVVDQGALDCFKVFKKGDAEKYLKTYKPGESFGELSLLYNAPRAASIRAKENSVLFSLDRETFNHIVKDSASKKREKYEEFLGKVELLKDIDPYERLQIADALKVAKYKPGEFIIKQGELGNSFYFVQEGNLSATKSEGGKPAEVVFKYKPGDYFGELALIRHEPRAANIIADTETVVVYLDVESFRRLIGPIEDILKRNAARYEKFLKR